MSIRVRRLAAAGVFTAAAFVAPVGAAVLGVTGSAQAAPACLAWYGNKDDGNCMGYSNGQPTTIGTPYYGAYGPNGGNGYNGIGVITGPLVPGQTWNSPVG